jgi:hypothetical protein
MKAPLRILAASLLAVAVQALMVTAFGWPAARTAPHDVPLVVAGPAPATAAVAHRLDVEQHGAFKVTTVPDEESARRALAGRRAYGAIVTGPAAPHVLVASAASPVVAQLLTQVAPRLSGRTAPAPQDVVAADRDDPRGAAFAALILPLVMSGVAGGLLLTFGTGSAGGRAAGLVVFAAGAGLASAAIVQTGLSVLPGPYALVAGVIGLATLAVSGTVAALGAVLGRTGLGVGAAAMMLLANPLSGVSSAPELLPSPWGAIGQAMPAGAGGTLLRSVAFFGGAGAGGPLTVLLAWSGGGLLLLAAAALRGRRDGSEPTAAPSRPVAAERRGRSISARP